MFFWAIKHVSPESVYSAIHPVCHNVLFRLFAKVVRARAGAVLVYKRGPHQKINEKLTLFTKIYEISILQQWKIIKISSFYQDQCNINSVSIKYHAKVNKPSIWKHIINSLSTQNQQNINICSIWNGSWSFVDAQLTAITTNLEFMMLMFCSSNMILAHDVQSPV